MNTIKFGVFGTAISPRRATLLLLCAFLLGGCGEGERQAIRPTPLDRAVVWKERIRLEENNAVVNVITRAKPDGRGRFLVTDEREGQVRLYGADGRLARHFGRRGDGPGEFNFLLGALRRSSGEIVAFDMFNKVVVFDSTGSRVLRTTRTPVGPAHSVLLLDDSLVLLGGEIRGGGLPGARLHVWNLASGRLVRSFFVPRGTGPGYELAAGTAGLVSVARRGDTIAATFALSDSVHLFTVDGTPLGAVPIPSRFLRRLDPQRVPKGRDVEAAREWLNGFSLVSDLFWLADGSFLVQYQDRDGPVPDWRLLRMSRTGRPLFESVDTPMLQFVDANMTVYFIQPGASAQNVWATARFAG
jgi:hypothetical protein